MNSLMLFTIGFAGKSAQEFFETLRKAEVRRLVDVRLNNASQLAGFTKKRDLPYFLLSLGGIAYAHEPSLAPTKDILDAYKKKRIEWVEYESRFMDLLQSRRPQDQWTPSDFDRACLLCSEATPEHCHRRLVAEFLRAQWKDLAIRHL